MRLLISFAAALFVTAAAQAADKPLTEDQAARFVASLDSVDALADKLREEGKTDQLKIGTEPKPGEAFKPYSNAVAALKEKFPADHARLDAAVKPHGFNAAEWGGVGDKVMVAYLALIMKEENPQGMAAMGELDPSMLAMMPPEMKAQIERAKLMMDAVKNAPEEDQKAVAKVRQALDAYMEKHEDHGAHAAHH